MSPRLPNVLIHLSAFFVPKRLRPDLRVPSIAHVDFSALRKIGFNAVVVDKDNCVTLPEEDQVYPPLQIAWNDLLFAFSPGRVLVVSNSAGTKRDPGGIAAESVSLSLRTPVLLHSTPKPGCATDILAYFRGELGKPMAMRDRILAQGQMAREEEEAHRKETMERWFSEIETKPSLGPFVDSNGNAVEDEVEKSKDTLKDKMMASQASVTPKEAQDAKEAEEAIERKKDGISQEQESPRIIVIGDRLFTDALLAHRLSLLLPQSNLDAAIPSVLSIHTTSLPQPRDVRLLRWIEDKLSRGRIQRRSVVWGKYTRDPNTSNIDSTTTIDPISSSIFDRWRALREKVRESRLHPDPRNWTLFSVTVGIGRGLGWTCRGIWRGASHGVRYIWTRSRRRWNRSTTPNTSEVNQVAGLEKEHVT